MLLSGIQVMFADIYRHRIRLRLQFQICSVKILHKEKKSALENRMLVRKVNIPKLLTVNYIICAAPKGINSLTYISYDNKFIKI